MKDLKDIINEAIVKGKLKNYSNTTYKNPGGKVIFPICEETIPDSEEYEFVGYKKYTLGPGPFYIYKDAYHGNSLHIIDLIDMARSIGNVYMDFEDFDESYIIADFPTLKDAAAYALADINKGKHYYDSKTFIEDVLSGEYDSNDYYMSDMSKESFEEALLDQFTSWLTLINKDEAIEKINKARNLYCK